MTRGVRRLGGRPVDVAVASGVARVTLAGGVLDHDAMAALADVCARIDADETVAVVVLASRGADFCRGLPAGCAWPPSSWSDGVGAVGRLRPPVVAALDGTVRGWGVSLALACDIRVATHRLRLVLNEGGVAAMPGGGLSQRLPRMVGVARTFDLLLRRGMLSAEAAAEWGLVNEVVAPGRLARATARVVDALSARGPVALRFAKEAVLRSLDLPLADGMRLEHDLYALLQTTADRREGVRAFLERRRPQFEAR